MSDYRMDSVQEFVGQELGVSSWVQIDQKRINDFADATGDHQWIHIDEAKANASPLGSTIAHGYLTLSLLPMLLAEIKVVPGDVSHVLNYGADKLRFTNFVKVDSKVRVRTVLLSAEPKGAGLLIKTRNTMEIDGDDKPAMVADTLTLAFPA